MEPGLQVKAEAEETVVAVVREKPQEREPEARQAARKGSAKGIK